LTKVKYAPEAQNDLVAIKTYIENDLENSIAAERVIKRIAKKGRLLETAPQIGTPLSSIIDIETDYRFLRAGNYLSFYRYVEYDNTCYIDRVLYIRRDYLTMLFGNTEYIDDTVVDKDANEQ
jgi:plasmid stabilization system protein ParE